ncbi:hypothetical protein FJT64_025502 [Amphibalanus amphitrite]|uniref:Uncharacterized protein n=1 Tax=Amphibalanus amphitrite TaxID=1232801 RepID=A0A6A4WB38_AMPAM|nr:hypothetical protein FJT64_025502 [Amphibalanus amphitrite]
MPGMFPKAKKSKLDICTETAKFSAKLKHADVTHKTSVLKDSFEVRRICLTSNRNRKTGEEMKEIFPDMYSEAAVWTDLGMIMGLEEDVKEHVLHKIRHTAKKYAQTMINVEPADKDDDELLALLAYGCGTTIGTLADPRNGVRQAGEELSVDGVVVCQLPATRLETVALMTAAHVVFYTKFTGPCRALFEILYRSVGFDVNLSGLSQKVWEVTQVV